MSIDSLTGFKAMCGVFTGLTVIAVALRFVARRKNSLPLKADDWCMLAALIFFLGNMTTMFLLARVNFSGYNGGTSSGEEDVYCEQVTSAYQLIIVWTLGAAKASVLFFYKRVFCQCRSMNSAFRIAIIITLVINACWVVAFFFFGLFQCGTHFSFGGNHFQYCTLLNQYQLGFYISDIVLDVWIMIMPIPYIIRLAMTKSRKCLIILIFLLTFVGLGASIARLVNYLQTPRINPGTVHQTPEHAPPHKRSAWTAYVWFGTLEMGTVIVAINLPTLYSLFSKYGPEVALHVTRSWTSIRSGAFSTSDKSGPPPAGCKLETAVEQSLEPGTLNPTPNRTKTVIGPDLEHVMLTDHAGTNEIHVYRTVQVTSEKPREEV